MELASNHKEKIADWAASGPSIRSVALFGSYAKGNATVGSDVDIAIEIVESEGPLATFIIKRKEWQNTLRILTGLPINLELLHEEDAPRVFAFVDECAIPLYRG